MALTPVEIRHVSLGRGLPGYKREQVDKLLADVAASFEDVWRERADLADKVEQLESDLVRYRELESLLRATLVSAERAAAELKEQARREAEDQEQSADRLERSDEDRVQMRHRDVQRLEELRHVAEVVQLSLAGLIELPAPDDSDRQQERAR